MGRPLLLLLLLAVSVFSDRCEEISSSVIFNQIAISSLLREQNVCVSDVKENAQAIVAKVEATDQGLKEFFARMQQNFTEELKTWLSTTLNKHTEEVKTWVSETVQNISEDLTLGEVKWQQILNMTESILQLQTTRQVTPEEQVTTPRPCSDNSKRFGTPTQFQYGRQPNNTQHRRPHGRVKDCLSHKLLGSNVTKAYVIYPFNCSVGVDVWCDMENDGGGWSVIVKRKEHTPQMDFRREWQEYKRGFGDPLTEYWLGNQAIHALTTGMENELRVDGEAFSSKGGRRHGYWNGFYIEDESNKYRLHIGPIRSADSTMGDTLYRSNNNKFTTIDSDNDSRGSENCASDYGGGGWWYDSCSNAFPTGPIVHTEKWDDSLNMYNWVPEASGYYSLRWVELKFRGSVKNVRHCDGS